MAVKPIQQSDFRSVSSTVGIVDRVRTPIVPTLPTLSVVLTERERQERLAYWIRDTMLRRRLTPPKLAELVGVSRSAALAWTKPPGESGASTPSMIFLGPLATALRVDPRLFADLPAIPPSGAADYLVEPATQLVLGSGPSGLQEGVRRGRRRQDPAAADTPAPSPRRRPRGDGAAHG